MLSLAAVKDNPSLFAESPLDTQQEFAKRYCLRLRNRAADQVLQDLAIAYGQSYGRMLARRFDKPIRFWLEEDDLYGELMLKLWVVIDHYLLCTPWSEFKQLIRSSMWNCMYSQVRKAEGTSREIELSAQALDEDRDWSGVYNVSPFILSEFMAGLSPLAQRIVGNVLDPDEDLQSELAKYIEYRNGLYKHGAGVSGIPPKIIAAAMDITLVEATTAYDEVKDALKERESPVDTQTLAVEGVNWKDPKFGNEVVTWQDVSLKYSRWPTPSIREQCKHRKVWEPDMSLKSDMVRALRKWDEDHSIPSDVDEPLIADTKPSAAAKAAVEKVVADAKKATVVEEDDDDDDEWDERFLTDQPTKVVEEPAEDDDEWDERFLTGDDGRKVIEEAAEEDVEFGPPLDMVQPADEPEKVEEPAKVEPVAEESKDVVKVEGQYKGENEEVFLGLMSALQMGHSVTVTRIGPNSWHVHKHSEAVSVPRPVVDTSEKVAPKAVEPVAPIPADSRPSPAAPAVDGRVEDKPKAKKEKKETTAEYDEFMAWAKSLPRAEVIATAKAEGATWKEKGEEGYDYMRACMALRKVRGIEKHKS